LFSFLRRGRQKSIIKTPKANENLKEFVGGNAETLDKFL